jgi:hypothetical protein
MTITDKTTSDLTAEADAIAEELARRRSREDAAQATDQMCLDYFHAAGRSQGEEWVEPMGVVGAYPRGWVVTHDGQQWAAVMPGIICPPSAGSHGWVHHEGEIIPFWQPGPYEKGSRVRDAGRVWVALSDVDGQRPSEYPGGWELTD